MRRGLRAPAASLALAAALGIGSALAQGLPPEDRRPPADMLGPETRAMQDDDTLNPGMLWVLNGEELWRRPAGTAQRACADCHGEASSSMRGVAARHPAYDPELERPVTLSGRIQACRREHQEAPALPPEDDDLLALEAFVAHQSRGMPVTVGEDGRLRPFIERGRTLFERRHGQLDLSCAECHDARWGGRLAGALIPQAHPTGYPAYRLEWQDLGSLQRRFRNCMTGVRATPFAFGSPEHVELELYLAWRAEGLPVETPGVRP